MEKALLKEKLHRLIDEVEDEMMLENLLEALHGYQQGPRKDILDELSEKQLTDLREAQEQVRNGQFITNEAVKAKQVLSNSLRKRTELVQFLRENSVAMPSNGE